ncbi:hypothetical protein KUTeg_012549 [Tegillarca granosa]|uniref:Cysteine protease n=1 Tax=Tegillarca granosa TaxID=220873 RepID=A0ABQ9EZW3_TEGGR|nr:hypothetical protein KUTeg_012549 [Tegillarca granosa]
MSWKKMDFDLSDVGTFTYESGPVHYDDFPQNDEPVYLLGNKYSTIYDRDELKHDFLSKIWITYRKNFAAIGGTGPTSDSGWGCMLRCGQMMLAQSLIMRHCGRDWRWTEGCKDEKYWKIIRMFQDKKSSYYSIQQIASMGVSEGKNIGQWFGPNTVAQVLKKLVVYDEWSSLVIHVAMDNTVIEEDIKCLCKGIQKDESRQIIESEKLVIKGAEGQSSTSSQCRNTGSLQHTKRGPVNVDKWKPLLLFIPLRLGLTDMNSVYKESLKSCLSFPHTVGIIGGRPNHAHWFVGYIDPHTTQLTVNLDDKSPSDNSYHCPYPCSMNIMDLDPSIAVGFYCGTEEEFDDLCLTIQKFITNSNGQQQDSDEDFELLG